MATRVLLFLVPPWSEHEAEHVLAPLDDITARLEVISAGECAFPMVGPTRFFGGEENVAAKVEASLRSSLGHRDIGIGIADGLLAARRAAQISRAQRSIRVVPPNQSAAFLAPQPVEHLGNAELAETLVRLGLPSIGLFAALEGPDVLARFGTLGRDAHRLARGEDLVDLQLSVPQHPIEATAELESPIEHVEQAAFLARSLADELHMQLRPRGLMCSLLLISAVTVSGECSERYWRHEGGLDAGGIAQRVRWQLDGWLTSRRGRHPGPVQRLTLRAHEVAPERGRQGELWGAARTCPERVLRGVARVQAVLGHDSVRVAEWSGGRSFAERYRLVSVESVQLEKHHAALVAGPEPWPGSMSGLAPSKVWERVLPAEVIDRADRSVGVNSRGDISAPPHMVSIDAGPWEMITSWGGPWLSDERWWDPVGHRRRARLQIVTDSNAAHLMSLEVSRWWCEATYD